MTPTPGFSIAFFSSTVGIAFHRPTDGVKFCLGLGSPPLERNSVCAIDGADPGQAAKIADDTATSESTLKAGKSTCTIRQASEWGNVNYCICALD